MQSAIDIFGQEIGAKRYGVVYADPPWRFKTYSEKGLARSAEAHYDCMTLDGIRALPVCDIAEKDAVLLLWATDPLLPMALDLIRHWGFTFKTVGFYWAKLNRKAPGLCVSPTDFFTGMGYWTRANVEQCLLATRGKPVRKSKAVRKLVVAPRREHSRKPDEMHGHIEALVDGPYLELFSRAGRPGWDSWGTQSGLFDGGEVKTRRRSSYSREPDRAGRTKGKGHETRSFDELWTDTSSPQG